MNNFLPLDRKIMEHWLWEEKPFSKGQAWIDLLMLANYAEKKKPEKGEVITYKRGNVNLSMKYLASRWGWDRRTVKRFLDLLESDGMVSVCGTTHGTTISIVNYEVFNSQCAIDNTTDCATDAQQIAQQAVQQVRTTNKENKDKEGEERKEKERVTKVTLCQAEARQAVDAWNNLEPFGITPISRLTAGSKRHESLVARIRQYGIDEVLKAIEKIKQSDFLRGNNNRGWSIKFDWFVKPSNFPKVLEGNYDDKPSPEPETAYSTDTDGEEEWQ